MNETEIKDFKAKTRRERYLFTMLIVVTAVFLAMQSSVPRAVNPLTKYNQPIQEREAIAITVISELMTTRDEDTKQFLEGAALEYWDNIVAAEIPEVEIKQMTTKSNEGDIIIIGTAYAIEGEDDDIQDFRIHFAEGQNTVIGIQPLDPTTSSP